ncbi:MAG TPA: DUF6504 family protein [Allosphingosinicella sp.]|nr:DUF6504 family protein [Allosphingosinicella sp.]
MPRVASLFLPNLATDRIRRIDGARGGGRHDRAPLITAGRDGQRIAVAAACPAAQAMGIRSGMALAQARLVVRGLDVRDSDPTGDSAFLQALGLFAARRWTPRAAPSDPAGLWLDLSGVAHLFGGEQAMARRILRFCARLGFTARIAVAGTAGAAHALARYGSRPVVLCPSGGEAEALAPLPVSALRLDQDVLGAARRLGIETIGELTAMPRPPLARRFGKTLLHRLDQALSRAAEPFDPLIPEEPPKASLRLAEPIATAEAIEQVIGDLMTMLVSTLEKEGLGARRLTLLCDRVDGEEQRIGIGTARASRDRVHLIRLLSAQVEKIEPGFGIEAMHLVAGRFEPLGPQPVESELGGSTPDPDLAPLVDRLAGRLGTRRIFRMSALESDVPERSVCRVPPLQEVEGWPSRWPRPPRLLSPPERLDNVFALLPDRPPNRFTWRGRLHRVRRGDGPERIYGEWWKHGGEAEAVRDYFQVEDEEGARFWLYRRGDGSDGRTGDLSWWLHGVFG